MQPLVPFLIDDDGAKALYEEERTTLLVWAPMEADALTLALAQFACPELYPEECTSWLLDPQHVLPEGMPPPISPGIEQRPEVLREAGLRKGNEEYCVTCGLAAYGLEQYAVCPLCTLCRACSTDTGPCLPVEE